MISHPSAPPEAETAIFPKEYQRFGGGQNHIKRLFSVIPAYFPPQNTFSSKFRRNGGNLGNYMNLWYLARKGPPNSIGICNVFVCFQLRAGKGSKISDSYTFYWKFHYFGKMTGNPLLLWLPWILWDPMESIGIHRIP